MIHRAVSPLRTDGDRATASSARELLAQGFRAGARLDLEPSAAAVEREAAESLGAGDEGPHRATGHDREHAARESVLASVHDERAGAGKRDDRDVALLVHVLRLPLALPPDEQRRVQLLGRRSPRRATPFERQQVDDVHPASVDKSTDLTSGMRPEGGFAAREARATLSVSDGEGGARGGIMGFPHV